MFLCIEHHIANPSIKGLIKLLLFPKHLSIGKHCLLKAGIDQGINQRFTLTNLGCGNGQFFAAEKVLAEIFNLISAF